MSQNNGSFTYHLSYVRERKVVSPQDTRIQTWIQGLLSSMPVTNRQNYVHVFLSFMPCFLLALQNLWITHLLLRTKQFNCGERNNRNEN
jgi:predicted phosphoadenosine phosphosulfate sulfurtransferase